MVELDKQDTKERNIMSVCNKDEMRPLGLAAMHSSDTATSKLLARECPGALYGALDAVPKYSKKSTAVVSLLRKCLAALEHGNISTLIELCGESDKLPWFKKHVERHPVHFAAAAASDIAIIKPVIREHAPELLTEDSNGDTPLDIAKRSAYPTVLTFFTEVDAAFHNCDYTALIRLCGTTPEWEQKAKNAKDRKKAAEEAAADALAAEFLDWDEKDT